MNALRLIPAAALAIACSGGSDSPTAAPTPATTPNPVGATASVSGRWVGNAPDGMIVTSNPTLQCPDEFDLELNLTSAGAMVTGTATTRLRKVVPLPCSDVLGRVSSYGLFNGRVDANAISFELGTTAPYRFTGTFTGTRMTGTFVIPEHQETNRGAEAGSFVVIRQ